MSYKFDTGQGDAASTRHVLVAADNIKIAEAVVREMLEGERQRFSSTDTRDEGEEQEGRDDRDLSPVQG